MKNIPIYLLFVLSSFSLNGQTSSTSDYFYNKISEKDQGINPGRYLKTDLISIIEGELPLLYGFRTGMKSSIECGIGLIFPYTYDLMNQVFPLSSPNPTFEQENLGFSFQINPRYGAGIERSGPYGSVPFKYRQYSRVSTFETGLILGYPFIVQNLLLEIELGYRVGKEFLKKGATSADYKYESSDLFIYGGLTFGLKIGLPVF